MTERTLGFAKGWPVEVTFFVFDSDGVPYDGASPTPNLRINGTGGTSSAGTVVNVGDGEYTLKLAAEELAEVTRCATVMFNLTSGYVAAPIVLIPQ